MENEVQVHRVIHSSSYVTYFLNLHYLKHIHELIRKKTVLKSNFSKKEKNKRKLTQWKRVY